MDKPISWGRSISTTNLPSCILYPNTCSYIHAMLLFLCIYTEVWKSS